MVPLKPMDLNYAHHARLQMVANVPPGTTLEDVIDPAFWVNHVMRLAPGTIIEVLSEDNVLDCELRVVEKGPTYAKVRVLRNYTPEDAAKPARPLPEDIVVDYGGKNDKWRVVHKGQVVSAGFGTREEANKGAEEYRAKFAA